MQWLLNGVANGSLIAVLALAFMLVYSTTGIFYVALGAIYAVAPFVAQSVADAGSPWWLALVSGALAATVLSAAVEAVNHWPLERRKSSTAAHLVSSLGLNILIVQVLAFAWGNELQTLGAVPTMAIPVLGLNAAAPQILAIVLGAVVFTTVVPWLSTARGAIPMRALAANPDELALTGANVRLLRLLVFAASGLLAALVSFVRSYDTGFDAISGLSFVVLGFAALLIGGRENPWGAALGGIILGVVRSAIAWFGAPQFEEPFTFVILASFLLFWPQGLLGRHMRLEAEP
jgi:branched-chain amino acid transport system permease protein